jgi:hypothetical protein
LQAIRAQGKRKEIKNRKHTHTHVTSAEVSYAILPRNNAQKHARQRQNSQDVKRQRKTENGRRVAVRVEHAKKKKPAVMTADSTTVANTELALTRYLMCQHTNSLSDEWTSQHLLRLMFRIVGEACTVTLFFVFFSSNSSSHVRRKESRGKKSASHEEKKTMSATLVDSESRK